MEYSRTDSIRSIFASCGQRPVRWTCRAALTTLLVLWHPLWAATIIVDETTCTLVDAITAANTDTATGGCPAGSGADIIELTTDVTLYDVNNIESGRNGLPAVASDITVQGGGFTIQRDVDAPEFRLFFVLESGTLNLNDVALSKGQAGSDDGGGILNLGTVGLTDSKILRNRGSAGGGVSTLGNLSVSSSTISGNSAAFGGGIHAYGNVSVTHSLIGGNSAVKGGGIVASGTMIVTNSAVSGNSAVSFSQHFRSYGGGVFVHGGSLILTNSTVSGNLAFSQVWYPYYGYQLTAQGGGIAAAGHGSSVSVANSIVAQNLVGDPMAPLGGQWLWNCAAVITDNGHNFADDGNCGPGFAEITPDVDFDTTLTDNGGPTQTHALLPGSVAINTAGDCELETDQRGFLRWDGMCDSGSYEYGAMAPDADQDGVLDSADICLGTTIPESVPTNHLQVNRWALVDEDEWFDTTAPPGGGGGPDFEFTTLDTGGCSCEQIIEELNLGWGHTKFGCSTGAILQWIDMVGDLQRATPPAESQAQTEGLTTFDTAVDGPSESGKRGDPRVQRQSPKPRWSLLVPGKDLP